MSDFFGANVESSLEKSVHDALWTPCDASGSGPVSYVSADYRDQELTPVECYALSISTRKCVEVRAGSISSARIRFWTDSGREYVKGPAISLFAQPWPRVSWEEWCYEWVSWYDILGEHAFQIVMGEKGPYKLKLLNPGWLRIGKPDEYKVEDRSDVQEWEYHRRHHADPLKIKDAELYFHRDFNPWFRGSNPVRGLSRLVTGGTHAGIGYFSSRYNKKALENDCMPQGILVLPEGTPKSQAEIIKQQFIAEHGSNKYRQNHRKISVITGGDGTDFKVLEQPFQDGAFMDAQSWADEKICQLFGVPPIMVNNLAKTRFDTANEEIAVFHQNTLTPLAMRLSQALQMQVVTPYFKRAGHTSSEGETKKTKMSKATEERFEKARAIAEGGVIVTIDPDTIPTMASVRAMQVQKAKDFREASFASPHAANEYAGIELNDPQNDELRKDLWIPNTYLNVTHPEMNAKLVPGVTGGEDKKPGDKKPAGDKPKPKKELTDKQRAACRKAEKLFRKLREMSLAAADSTSMWRIDDAEAVANELFGEMPRKVWKAIRSTYSGVRHNACSEDLGTDARKEAIRAYFNALTTKSNIRSLLGF